MKKFLLAIFLSALVMPSINVYARRSNSKKSVKSTVDFAAAKDRIRGQAKELMKCFNSFVPDAENPAPARVQIWVELDISPSGKATDLNIISSTVSDTKPEECMVKVLSGITYPKPSSGAASSLTVKLTFRRGADDMAISTF